MSAFCPDHGTELDDKNRCPHGHNVKADEATNEPGRPWL